MQESIGRKRSASILARFPSKGHLFSKVAPCSVGKRVDDWSLPPAHRAKVLVDDDAHVTKGRFGGDDESVWSGHCDADSACSGYSEHGNPHDDAISVDQELPLLTAAIREMAYRAYAFPVLFGESSKAETHNALLALSLPPYIGREANTVSDFRIPFTASLENIQGG